MAPRGTWNPPVNAMPCEREAPCISSLVKDTRLPVAGIRDVIVFPAPDGCLPAAALRQLANCALFRLDDATVWFLRTRGNAWTDERLARAARVLLDETRLRHDGDRLVERLRHVLRTATLATLPATLHDVDAIRWELRNVAIACMLRAPEFAAGGPGTAQVAAAASAREAALHASLAAALARFDEATDREALHAVTAATGAADIAVYNYLAEPRHRGWRLQLARTFPLFLRAAATGGPASVGATLRAAVDDGAPLLRHLADRWGVSAGAIRMLRQLPAARVGAQWEDNVRGLVRLLDVLRPEDRPQDDPAAWARFNHAVAVAERIFRCPPWASPAAQVWLRDAARRGLVDVDDAAAQAGWSPARIAAVQRFRDALARLLELGHGDAANAADAVPRLACEGRANRFVATRPPRRLAALARRFEREWRDPPAELAQASSRVAGESYLPLLPAELVAADGSRIASPLTDRGALDRHGRALDTCLDRAYLGPPGIDASNAARFIVGFLHARTRAPASTAEIRATRKLGDEGCELEVLQHTGFRNRLPSQPCIQALAETLAAARSRAGRAHLEAAFRALRDLGRRPEAAAKREAERILLTGVLTRTLGPALLAELGAAGAPGGEAAGPDEPDAAPAELPRPG